MLGLAQFSRVIGPAPVHLAGIPKRGGDALLQAAVRLTPFLKPAAAAPAAG